MSNLAFKRKREGKTNYKKRLSLLVSRELRAVVRKTLRSVQIQIIEYNPDGDKVLASAHSRELSKYGFKYNQSNLSTAYLTGLLCAKKAQKAGIKKAIIDLGLQKPQTGGKVYAAVKGLVDGGLEVPVNAEAFPSDDRISGKHIEAYAKDNPDNFGGYKKAGVDAGSFSSVFEKVKESINNA